MDYPDGGAVIAEGDAAAVAGLVGADGNPAGIVKQGVGDDASGLVVLGWG
jgi:hypothetical protein